MYEEKECIEINTDGKDNRELDIIMIHWRIRLVIVMIVLKIIWCNHKKVEL